MATLSKNRGDSISSFCCLSLNDRLAITIQNDKLIVLKLASDFVFFHITLINVKMEAALKKPGETKRILNACFIQKDAITEYHFSISQTS